MRASEAANVKKRWREQHDDVLFPDEVRLYLCFYTVPHARLLLVISCHLFTQLPSPAHPLMGRGANIISSSNHMGTFTNMEHCTLNDRRERLTLPGDAGGHTLRHSGSHALRQVPGPAKLAHQRLGP